MIKENLYSAVIFLPLLTGHSVTCLTKRFMTFYRQGLGVGCHSFDATSDYEEADLFLSGHLLFSTNSRVLIWDMAHTETIFFFFYGVIHFSVKCILN